MRASLEPTEQRLAFLDSHHFNRIRQQMGVLELEWAQSQFTFDDMLDSFVTDPEILHHFPY